MCATRTQDVRRTLDQIQLLARAGTQIVRIAVDSIRDVEALKTFAGQVEVPLSVDLQESYRLAEAVAPWVAKIRYNPGHLHHHERSRPWQDKVRWLAEIADRYDCALRVGVNCGSIDPAIAEKFPAGETVGPMVALATMHAEFLESIGFHRYCVSLKDSSPERVIEANFAFARQMPHVPLHLGLTEAGLPPEGVWKTRRALMPLLAQGIGETIRVSLTVPADRKHEEVLAAQEMLRDVASGNLEFGPGERLPGLDIISCPSCSRVENERFVDLAEQVRQMTRYAADVPLTIAVMGCRVNGPGETDHADLGLWCGPNFVNLKRGSTLIGRFSYEEILPRLKEELDRLIAERTNSERSRIGQ